MVTRQSLSPVAQASASSLPFQDHLLHITVLIKRVLLWRPWQELAVSTPVSSITVSNCMDTKSSVLQDLNSGPC